MGNSFCTMVASVRNERHGPRYPIRLPTKTNAGRPFTHVAKYIVENQSSTETPNSEICVICLEDILDKQYIIKLPCDHMYHSDCLYRWLCRKQVCPMCNAPLKFDLNVGV